MLRTCEYYADSYDHVFIPENHNLLCFSLILLRIQSCNSVVKALSIVKDVTHLCNILTHELGDDKDILS